jgi:PiT family inorganic phosphate transporter
MGGLNNRRRSSCFLLGQLPLPSGFTYSKRVVATVGQGIFKLSPVAAFVVVSTHSVVLFLFAMTFLVPVIVFTLSTAIIIDI